jgi:hypothetical protein
MGELTWAQVMPAEAYWRERIAHEIMSIDLNKLAEVESGEWMVAAWMGAARMRLIAFYIAKGKEE